MDTQILFSVCIWLQLCTVYSFRHHRINCYWKKFLFRNMLYGFQLQGQNVLSPWPGALPLDFTGVNPQTSLCLPSNVRILATPLIARNIDSSGRGTRLTPKRSASLKLDMLAHNVTRTLLHGRVNNRENSASCAMYQISKARDLIALWCILGHRLQLPFISLVCFPAVFILIESDGFLEF